MARIPLITPSQTTWPEALARAIAAPEAVVTPVFQPVVDLRRGIVSGYEVLARFAGPPATTPDMWFAAAARYGLAGRLEAVMIRAGLHARALLPPDCFISINVGPRALRTPEVQAAFRESGGLDAVVIEITEQDSDEDYVGLRAALAPLRDAGATVAVDDAGSGYASLSRITALRPEYVKLDRALLAEVDRDPAKLAAVESLGALAERLDAWVVAEGIERLEELDECIKLHVPFGQGFALGRPAPTMEMTHAELNAYVRGRSHDFEELSGVGTLAERTPEVPLGADQADIERLIAAGEDAEFLPLVDERHRPLALLSREGMLRGERPFRGTLRVNQSTPVAAVARRAMSRGALERFDPLLCCDGRGRYVGLVRVERLIEELAA